MRAHRTALREVEAKLIDGVVTLSRHWVGTKYGLGAPQTSSPGEGKINCGTFVGTLLRDVGFHVDVSKLQQQPSQLIIATFVGPERTMKFSNAPMKTFLAAVDKMGVGLYIIGLDFHVGLLIKTEHDLRFLHADYISRAVVNEPAASAEPIVTSRYRVVGKILSAENLRSWLDHRVVEVRARRR